MEDEYVEDESVEHDYVCDEEGEYSGNSESEFSGEVESDYILTTSCDEDSCCSGYDE